MDKFYSEHYFEIWLEQVSPEVKIWLNKKIAYLDKNIKFNSKILDMALVSALKS